MKDERVVARLHNRGSGFADVVLRRGGLITRALSTFGVVLLLSVAPPIEVSAQPAVEASAGVVVPVGKLAGFRDRGDIAAIAAEQQIRGTSSVRGVWPTST